MRRRIRVRPFEALNEEGELVPFNFPEMWVHPQSKDGLTHIEFDGRFHFYVSPQTLENCTRPF
jgi:hypothetical protein